MKRHVFEHTLTKNFTLLKTLMTISDWYIFISHDATKIQHEHEYSWIKYDNLCLIPAYLPIAVTALCLYLAQGIP